MIRTFSDLPGWSFDIDEVSAGVYQIVATDKAGHRISKTGIDPAALIEECRRDAGNNSTSGDFGSPITMTNFDHYKATRELVSLLDQGGYTSEAVALRAAMDEGATGTEIFMALRFHLAEIVKRVPLKGDSQILASRLLAELDEALE